MHTRSFLAGVCFGTIFKPPLSGYGVCAAMRSRCLAAPMIVACKSESSLFDQTAVFPSYFREEKSLKSPNYFRVLCSSTTSLPCFTCCRSNAGRIDIIYSDNNAVFFPVLTPMIVKHTK